ncbi:HAMP domain-containing histidine kinase [Clostridium sp. D2Q-11]|uniref:histidine kinase n=1 Tax=Anaeromonas frigoriresistens TaxID=2683708 RepID=A0A942UWF1_9FIRM|nr:HAMP domain-containing sensor histidine kinase [Anaeromonas frigoriresistens]MBS4539325.1 HAMP domain-containing histidine kinase [Anaeromonas frigoriresistens]
MDTKLKSFSHSPIIKVIAFVLAIVCFIMGIFNFIEFINRTDGNLGILAEDNYYESRDYFLTLDTVANSLTTLLSEYKSEEEIRAGNTINEDYFKERKYNLFYEWQSNSTNYNPNKSEEENFKVFEKEYKDRIEAQKESQILDDLQNYNMYLNNLDKYNNILYYAKSEESVFKNTSNTNKEYFQSYPSYLIFDNQGIEVHPEDVTENRDFDWIPRSMPYSNSNENKLYIAFTKEYLNPIIEDWKEDKDLATQIVYDMLLLLTAFLLSFIYLIYSIGRKSTDDDIHLNFIDKIFNDIKIVLAGTLIFIWIMIIGNTINDMIYEIIIPITILISTVGFLLVLSLIKHIKNRTFFKYSITYMVFSKLFNFFKDTYNSGSVGVKIVLIVIGYPLLVALTFFMFPVTVGFAAWLALKKVKEFNAIKDGVEKVKDGDLSHEIDVNSKGEFGKLATNINSIADGLNNAVDNELRSERLKTELISNVSHDIRTPLTSIITYVDLLKNENDPQKNEEYIKVIDQKSQRLKVLTDDLFEASKATSGNIPVNYEKIDVLSLLTQGLGELNDRIKESKLQFKITKPKEKVYAKADGKLLWRSIENLLNNVLKYAQSESRVYIDIGELEGNIYLTIKNISAYELNIHPNELMERFKRGDESRHSPGSGLGLSIAKSLIELQKGEFKIEIDGDLFKAILILPKYE